MIHMLDLIDQIILLENIKKPTRFISKGVAEMKCWEKGLVLATARSERSWRWFKKSWRRLDDGWY